MMSYSSSTFLFSALLIFCQTFSASADGPTQLVRCYYRNDARDLSVADRCNLLRNTNREDFEVTNRYKNSRRNVRSIVNDMRSRRDRVDNNVIITKPDSNLSPPPRPNKPICSVDSLSSCRRKFDNRYANTVQFSLNNDGRSVTYFGGCSFPGDTSEGLLSTYQNQIQLEDCDSNGIFYYVR
eukprot:Awhi_evm1s14528